MTTVKAREKHVTVNGVRLRSLDWGTAGKMPIAYLHRTQARSTSGTSSQRPWPPYHVLAVNQRGHGESQWANTGYERDRFVEDLAAFMDALSFQRVVLVGLSIGGWHSMLYTPDHQKRVERIVIVDIAPEPGNDYV